MCPLGALEGLPVRERDFRAHPMLDEVLTPEERAVVAKARAFAEQHVAPHAARREWERHYPLETIKLACAAGLNTIELAKQHGGQGLSFSCKLRAFEEIAKAGATAIIQPGGSMRDQEVIDAANKLGLAMVVTGVRHFRH